MKRFHIDTDFLVHALGSRGSAWRRLRKLNEEDVELEISAIAWYEFVRGPRSPEQIALARSLFQEEAVIAFSEAHAEQAANVFRSLGSARRRAADIAIGVMAIDRGAALLTGNSRDYSGIEGLVLEPMT